eukprot:m.122228 g.122228  ORF g.122228 m.122228 type:complete len:114 (-) comp13723_c1_seq1:75-416(-)
MVRVSLSNCVVAPFCCRFAISKEASKPASSVYTPGVEAPTAGAPMPVLAVDANVQPRACAARPRINYNTRGNVDKLLSEQTTLRYVHEYLCKLVGVVVTAHTHTQHIEYLLLR